jgi:hypothetical protein
MHLCVSIVSILLTTTPALAATITVRPQTPDRPIVIMVEGTLVAVDEDQFAAKTAPLSSAFVAFSSDGGSLVAGLRIGEAIRRKGFSTIVPDGRRCASACALAWLGGIERFIGADARIGFHAAYDSASGRESGVGNTLLNTYLTKIGLPYEAVMSQSRLGAYSADIRMFDWRQHVSKLRRLVESGFEPPAREQGSPRRGRE